MTIDVNAELRVVPSCGNCRNQNSSVCRKFLNNKLYYGTKKAYCKFWVYQPNGMWK